MRCSLLARERQRARAGGRVTAGDREPALHGRAITLEFTKEALRDRLSLQAKLVTVENIQKTVADYCKVRLADLLSKRRSLSMARPRQVAMALTKELTSHSLPEIGDAFGGERSRHRTQAGARAKEFRSEGAFHVEPGRLCWRLRGVLDLRSMGRTSRAT